ncbi:hypothetical protein [Flavobacterium tegetincola]|uniref:hypothetical protein n=1 Tax=Flavobacterium tegetincola TaxID=150172 RepID=UPI00040A9123|nr:hypothetical protein [Flavobacterium tegetincola]
MPHYKKHNSLRSIVPAVLMCAGLFVFSSCSSSQKEELGTFDDPKEALLETQKVLLLLSENVNKGYKTVDGIKEYEITKNKIFTLK